ncbi:MAG: 50S ribosomal protein L9 [Gammaproteobacteria bacterium]|jgi:large subunit ribosomal protein L9|nr:50S ribosomal protein L9 [Gammaproteobacteria bacterium]
MQVILLEKNHKLGELGDIANVKSGYARNYLIPQGKAKPATKENLAEFELIKVELEKKEATALADAQTIESKMTDITCSISANAGEEGKLFGSVGPIDIVKSLHDQGFEIEKRDVNMPEAIRYIGEYEVTVDLHTDIVVPVKVLVEASTEEE